MFYHKVIIPRLIQKKWIQYLNQFIHTYDITTGLVVRLDYEFSELEVVTTSTNLGNPFHTGNKAPITSVFESASYQQFTDIRIITDLTKEEHQHIYKKSIFEKLNFKSLVMFPLKYPDGNIFGSLGFLNKSTFDYDKEVETKILEIISLIENDLDKCINNKFIGEDVLVKYFENEDVYNHLISRISELEKSQSRLERMASIDFLTKLYNRRYYMEYEKLNIKYKMDNNIPFSVIYIDMDGFKLVNDQFGHSTGDTILVRFATLFKNTFRKEDICGRVGGDEFTILLPNTELKDAITIADRFRETIEKDGIFKEFGVTVSMGVAEFMDSENQAQFSRRLDELTYKAKSKGKNTVIY